MIHYYYLSLGSNPLSLSLTELPNSSTSPQLKTNPSVQSMMIRMMMIVMALLRMITILMILMVAPPPKASSCMVVFKVLELN